MDAVFQIIVDILRVAPKDVVQLVDPLFGLRALFGQEKDQLVIVDVKGEHIIVAVYRRAEDIAGILICALGAVGHDVVHPKGITLDGDIAAQSVVIDLVVVYGFVKNIAPTAAHGSNSEEQERSGGGNAQSNENLPQHCEAFFLSMCQHFNIRGRLRQGALPLQLKFCCGNQAESKRS